MKARFPVRPLPGMSEKNERHVATPAEPADSKSAVLFFLQSREVGELEIALSFALLRMSWDR